uniref:G-protein coupled receptors family 1 profile domain-containing protein n=1 Tax=Gouania willdenowi TaxID=441366 RepID=A0A8C5NAL6_GOUWI
LSTPGKLFMQEDRAFSLSVCAPSHHPVLHLCAHCDSQPAGHHLHLTLQVLTCSVVSMTCYVVRLLVFPSISSRKLHTPTNFLLLSLAVSDFSVGFVWVFMILLIDGCWFLGADLCVFNAALSFVSTSASIGTVVLISVDRYVAVCDPILYYNIENPGQFDSCAVECAIYIHPVGRIMNVVLTFIIPVSIIVVLYVRVFIVAVSQAQAMRSHVTVVTLQSSLKVNRSELKAARALGVVVVVFLMCLTPLYLVSLTTGVGVGSLSSYIFVICLFFFNSLLNPVIYVFLYPWFRKCVKCVFSLQILKSVLTCFDIFM